MSTGSGLEVGDSRSFEWHFSRERVQLFSEVTGDSNPIHLDEDYARQSFFKGIIVHGGYINSVVGGFIGTRFPGEGCVIISGEAFFRFPVYVGSIVRFEVYVCSRDSASRLVMGFYVFDQKNRKIARGSFKIRMP